MSEWEEFSAYQGLIVDAKREERERIIELLKEQKHDLIIDQNHNGGAVLRDSIALIKGEE